MCPGSLGDAWNGFDRGDAKIYYIFKLILNLRDSQCKDDKTGVMWLCRLASGNYQQYFLLPAAKKEKAGAKRVDL